MILAGDIGGTKVNLALFERKGKGLEKVHEAKFESAKYSGLNQILEEYCRKKLPELKQAGFGIAGPVKEGRCEVTNLPWVVDVKDLKEQLQMEDVWLINDLAATACAVPFLKDTEVDVLQAGAEVADGRIAVIAAGTGLGEAFLMPDGQGRYLILDAEGGHCDFAPRTELQTKLLLHLKEKFGRVSLERVLSGPGLHNIYQFINEYHCFIEPDWLTEELRIGDPGVVITRCGLEKSASACEKALKVFVSIYGAAAGNLALQVLSRGGVYVGGGIAPKILPLIKTETFMDAFLAKGRFQPFMEEVPVKVILNDKAALLGAAHYALGEKFAR